MALVINVIRVNILRFSFLLLVQLTDFNQNHKLRILTKRSTFVIPLQRYNFLKMGNFLKLKIEWMPLESTIKELLEILL